MLSFFIVICWVFHTNSWKRGRALYCLFSQWWLFSTVQNVFFRISTFPVCTKIFGQTCDLPVFSAHFGKKRTASGSSGAALVIGWEDAALRAWCWGLTSEREEIIQDWVTSLFEVRAWLWAETYCIFPLENGSIHRILRQSLKILFNCLCFTLLP